MATDGVVAERPDDPEVPITAATPPASSAGADAFQLDRWSTAAFIQLSDVITVVVVFLVQWLSVDSFHELLTAFPSSVVSLAIAVILLRLVLLAWLTESWKNVAFLMAVLASLFPNLIAEDYDDAQDVTPEVIIIPRPERLRINKQKVRDAGTGYYVLLGLGILAQVLLVAASGGVVESPYVEILVATFVIGQVRSPTWKSIVVLVVAGMGSATIAHLIYDGFLHIDRDALEEMKYSALAHIAPLILVALITTLVTVSQVVNRNRQRSRLKVLIASYEEQIASYEEQIRFLSGARSESTS